MSASLENVLPNGPVAILSPTQGLGFGAEAVLEDMLRGWPADASPLVVVSPPSSRFGAICNETAHHHVAFPSSRDAIVPNLLATNSLALPDVTRVHAWSARAFELALLLGRRLGVPVSGTQHDHPQAAFIGLLRQKIMRHAAHRFSALGCVSQATLDACRDSGYRGRLEVAYNGLCDFAIKRVPAGEDVRVGFLGMHMKRKGFELLQQWIPHLMANRHLVLKLYGEPHPDFARDVAALAREFPDRVLVLGACPRETIFGEIDILLHAATEFEPFATVLLEAALAGLPCVASSAGGAGEAVVDGKTGLVFDPGHPQAGLDALTGLCDDAALRLQLGAAARRHYEERFRVNRMIQAYARLWQIH